METLLEEHSAYVESDGESVLLSNELGAEVELSVEAFNEAQEAIDAGEDTVVDGHEFVFQPVGPGMDLYVAPEGAGATRGEAIGYDSASLVGIDI